MPILPYEGKEPLPVNLQHVTDPLAATDLSTLVPKQPVPIVLPPSLKVIRPNQPYRTRYRLRQTNRPHLKLRLTPHVVPKLYGKWLFKTHPALFVFHRVTDCNKRYTDDRQE